MMNHKIAIFILYVTLATAIISIVIFSVLVALRFFHDKKKKIRQDRKEELRRKIFLYLSDPSDDLKWSLVRSKTDLAILIEIAHDLLRNLKGSLYILLLKAFSDVGLRDYVAQKLFSNRRKEYLSVIGVASYWAEDEIKQRLIYLLRDKSYLVRYSAAESLAYTHDIELLPILIKKFTKEKDFSYIMMASIFDIFGSQVAPEMLRLLQDKNTSNSLKKASLLVLASYSNAKEVGEVFQLLCLDRDGEVRALAFFALAKFKIRVPIKLLEKAKKDKSWKVRQFVAQCSAYNFPLSAKILADLLGDENWLVGLQAAKSLIASGSQGKVILTLISKNYSLDGDRAKMIMAEEGGENGD